MSGCYLPPLGTATHYLSIPKENTEHQVCVMIAGISIWQVLIVLAITVLLFGTGKIKTIGSDMGGAIKSFKSSLKDDDHFSLK